MKNFKRFTLAVYILLMLGFFTALVVGLGIIPGIGITLTLFLFDAATFNLNSTLIYGLESSDCAHI